MSGSSGDRVSIENGKKPVVEIVKNKMGESSEM